MLKNLWMRRKSVIISWFISYISILFIPIFISSLVYIESSKTLESEISRANDSMLRQVRLHIDNYLESINRLNTEITWNPKVQNLLYSGNPLNRDYQFEVYQIVQDLKMNKAYYPHIDNFYLYSIEIDFALLPGTQRDSRFLYSSMHESPQLSYENWLSSMKIKDQKKFVSMPRKTENGQNVRSIAFVSSLPAGKSENPVGTIVIMIDSSRIQEAIENVHWIKDGSVQVIDKDNQLLLSTSPMEKSEALVYDKFTGDSGVFYDRYNGEDSVFYYIKSRNSDLKYISVLPSKVIWQKADYVRKLTYLSFAMSILAGGLLTFLFLRKNYNPVHKLVQVLSGKGGITFGKGYNEYRFLQDAISTTLDEKEKICKRLQQQNNVLRSNFIIRLLKGRLESNMPIAENLAAFNMKFISDNFGVILFYLEDYSLFFSKEENLDDTEKFKLLQFIMTNVIEELSSQLNNGYMSEVDNMMACLISFNRSEGAREEMLRIAREAQKFLSDKFNIHLTISISTLHQGVQSIAAAYNEALDAMEYKIVVGSSEIICYDEIRHEAANDNGCNYYYPLQTEQHLINCVKVGNFESAREALENVFESNFKNTCISVQIARCLMFDMVSTMVKTINELGDEKQNVFIEKLSPVERLVSCKSIKEMKTEMLTIVKEVCDYTGAKRRSNLQQQRESAGRELQEEIVRFIGEHYSDVNLNISMIGEKFDLTPTYLSRLFKEQTGEGLLDCINKVRIDKAKQLLNDKKSNINDIARTVGYNDSNALIRAFKRYEGITPGKYKDIV